METNQAEVKTLKFGETLPDGAEGNPEPSLLKEGVETKQGSCLKCNSTLNNRRKKYCSTKCSTAYNMQRYRIRHNLVERPGVGSGNNQSDNKNHQYKNGWTTYNKKAFGNKPRLCNRCSSEDNLLVHHIDHDRSNSELNNLEILCKRCHQEHHCVRDSLGRYTTKQNKKR